MKQPYFVFGLLLFFACNSENSESSSDSLPTTPFIQVMGIAQDAGFPQANCQRYCCRRVWKDPSAREKVSCLAIIDPIDQQGWLLDATPDFKDQLYHLEQALPTTKIDLAGILLTHAHMGHYTGLMHLGREAMGAKEVPVYAMSRLKGYLESNGPWSQLVELKNIQLKALKQDSIIVLNERIRVTPIEVPHRDEFSETVGFIVATSTKKALFIPDIDKWNLWERDILALLKEVDVAYLDGTFYQNGEILGRDMSQIPHPFIEESLQLFETLSAEDKAKVQFIHFNHTNPVLQPDSKAKREVLQKGYGLAQEGAIFSL